MSLLVLDFVGVFAAILTALCIKAAAKGAWDFDASLDETRHTVAFAYLVTALLFARSGLYARRSERPGLTRIVSSLFQVAVVALIFAVVNGEQFQSYYIFYGSLFFAVAYISLLRCALRVGDRPAAARGGLPAPGRARRHRPAHRGGRPRAQRRRARVDQRHRLHLAEPAPGQRAAVARRARRHRRDHRPAPHRRGDHRRPGLPRGAGGRARRPVPPARRARAHRAVDDGDPRPPRGVRPGAVGPAVRAQAAGLRRRRLRDEADVRPRRRDAVPDRAEPGPARLRRRDQADARAGRSSTARCGPASAARRSPASSSARCTATRRTSRTSSSS